MTRRIITAAAFAIAAASQATAADMPYKAAPSLYNWSGFYAGINGGYGWTGGSSANGAFGGGQIGVNWQNGNWVFGVEADLQASGIETTTTASSGGATIRETTGADYFGTVRGRIGAAFDRVLVYGTAGLIYARISHDGTGLVGIAGSYSATNTKSDFVYGAGVEWAAWERWTVKLEYLHAEFGGNTNLYTTTAPAILVSYPSSELNLVRLGLNYRF
jgi:outer membrane immunogenic protein